MQDFRHCPLIVGMILASGLLNIAVTYALVPRHGAQGAATAFLIGQAVLFALYLVSIIGNAQRRAYFAASWRRG